MEEETLYREIEKALVKEVYPELCRLLEEKGRTRLDLELPEGFAKTRIYSDGRYEMYDINPEYSVTQHRLARLNNETYQHEEKIWIVKCNVLSTKRCPRYLRYKENNNLYDYIKYAEIILKTAKTLRAEKERMTTFIVNAERFSSSVPREMLTEKTN